MSKIPQRIQKKYIYKDTLITVSLQWPYSERYFYTLQHSPHHKGPLKSSKDNQNIFLLVDNKWPLDNTMRIKGCSLNLGNHQQNQIKLCGTTKAPHTIIILFHAAEFYFAFPISVHLMSKTRNYQMTGMDTG